mmetsp:Transcript_16596/g.25124  ORF Transcript_16596/g.25124 Transcript_16596/m.25124 type:complete len:157 (+) Transcript_16596:100-570(+)
MSSCCSPTGEEMSNQTTFLDTFKSGSKRFATLVADTGAKTMLKTDVAFLERDIKNRKHTFGIQIYEILQSNAKSSSTSDTVFSASNDIQTAFEECKLDVETLEKKIEKKREEMVNIGDGQQQQQPQQQQHDEGGGGDGESVSGRNAELESGILPGY